MLAILASQAINAMKNYVDTLYFNYVLKVAMHNIIAICNKSFIISTDDQNGCSCITNMQNFTLNSCTLDENSLFLHHRARKSIPCKQCSGDRIV